MKSERSPDRRRRSIRTRILAIVGVPSAALLVLGSGAAGYLGYQGYDRQEFSSASRDAAEPGAAFLAAVQGERRLTIEYILKPADRTPLELQRQRLDAAIAALAPAAQALTGDAPPETRAAIARFRQTAVQLPLLRQQIDARRATVTDVYGGYSLALDAYATGLLELSRGSNEAETTFSGLTALDLFRAADAMARADSLVAVALSPSGLSQPQYQEYARNVGAYHELLEDAAPRLPESGRRQLAELQAGRAWETIDVVEDRLLRNPLGGALETDRRVPSLPVDTATWQAASAEVTRALNGLYASQAVDATQRSADAGRTVLLRAIAAAGLVLLTTLLVAAIAVRLSRGLVQRLTRLRTETLDLVGERLPQMMERLRAGRPVDVSRDLPALEFGEDEIGQVAAAFNSAQQTAAAAAKREADTRAGTEKVFLNIAHRSQVVVHQQLGLLDRAERSQDDPDQLDLLFQLDHLATRARRNAENLIILGGGQPGRQWRNPVPLVQVVRSAVGEAESYLRVSIEEMPAVAVTGAAVADLIHLLAELVDNATRFSPPTAPVEIHGTVVGRGIAIEIEDGGLGIEPAHREQLNDLLHSPPDFGVMALSQEPRLGAFVVARLAARHRIGVTLLESAALGGTKAVILVPTAVVESPARVGAGPVDAAPDDTPAPARRLRPRAASRSGMPAVAAAPPAPPAPPPATPPAAPVAPAPVPVGHRTAAPEGPSTRPLPVTAPVADGRPALPKRVRQANLAPQLREAEAEAPAEIDLRTPPRGIATAEEARDRFAAFQHGTRRARAEAGTGASVGATGEGGEETP